MRSSWILAAILLGLVLVAPWSRVAPRWAPWAGADSLPDQRQGERRVAGIRALEVPRALRLRTVAVPLGDPRPSPTDTVRLRYVVRAPASPVEDADVRGYLSGETRYLFNQGTSYHLRVGRRYASAMDGRYELKRSLIRFPVPELPPGARLERARLRLWIERFYFNSPLARTLSGSLPLHLYAYPIGGHWDAGHGGINRDDFSVPGPGEVSWLEARTGSVAWRTPGVLEPAEEVGRGRYREPAAAMAPVERDDAFVTLEGSLLTDLVNRSEGEAVNLLLKLGDEEEDRPGTELALLSSDFGDAFDLRPRRPTLEVDVTVPCPCDVRQHDMVLEVGEVVELPLQTLGGEAVLLDAALLAPGGSPGAALSIRGGGPETPPAKAPWSPVADPVVRQGWTWWQARVSNVPRRLEWGDTLTVELKETWVQPGRRSGQRPELVLVSPSGRVLRVQGDSIADLRYRLGYVPDEVGLWRYGWSFRPTRQRRPGSHVGDGLVWVRLPSTEDGLQVFAHAVRARRDSLGFGDPAVQTNVNALSRWIGRAPEAERQGRRDFLERVIPGINGR